jgi:nitrate/nitrite transport system ATP-binding protein
MERVSGRAFVEVRGLGRIHPGRGRDADTVVFEGLDLLIPAGQFVCVVGHSGCGKTTLLRALAGLDAPSAGEVLIEGEPVSGPGLDRGVVFQGNALLPWLTVLENVAFAVRSRWPKWSRDRVLGHSREHLARVGLGDAERRRPAELSGGMKQRVGIARAFAIQPRLLLLDEPFGALDALTRGTIQDELRAIVRDTRQTVFMITHDIDEALLLADRIVLMSRGPRARIADVVTNTLPRERTRAGLHREPRYYPLRNRLVDFLVEAQAPAEPARRAA